MNELHPIWDLTPHSHATNSYELLLEVRKVIQAEPKRFFMNKFIADYLPDANPEIERGPVCGTVACFAGWIHTLKIPSLMVFEKNKGKWSSAFEVEAFGYFPAKCFTDLHRLFWGEFSDYQHDGPKEYPFPPAELYGTPAYARKGVQNLDKFMTKWEKDLKEFPLTPVRA